MSELKQEFFTKEEQEKIDKIKEYIETNKEDIKTKYSERTYVSFYYDEENDEVKVCDGIYNSSSGLEVKYNLKETVFDDISVFESYKPIKIGYYYSEELSSRIIIDKDGGKIKEYYHEGQLTSRTTIDKDGGEIQEYYHEGQLTSRTTIDKDGGEIQEYYRKGQLRSRTTIDKDGGEIQEYYRKGQLTSRTTIDKDGGEIKEYYHEGQLTSRTTKDKDGRDVRKYYENGQLSSRTTEDKDGRDVREYYENGQLLSRTTEDKDGRNLEEIYHSNGQLLSRTTTIQTNKEIEQKNITTYNSITIIDFNIDVKNPQHSSTVAYLRNENQNENDINLNNKIYTVNINKDNPQIKTYTFHTTNSKIGLDKDIQVSIDENDVITKVQTTDGKDLVLTEEEKNKIKNFRNSCKNVLMEEMLFCEPNIDKLCCATTLDTQQYKDASLIKLLKYNKYKENEEVDQTQELINQIPQDKKKGKYILVSCSHLIDDCPVDLMIDFDNKKLEIVGTANNIEQNVLDSLQEKLDDASTTIFGEQEVLSKTLKTEYEEKRTKIFDRVNKQQDWKKMIDKYDENDDESKLRCILQISEHKITEYSNKDEKKCNKYTKLKKEVNEALKLLLVIENNNTPIHNTEDSKKDKSRDENSKLKKEDKQISNATNKLNEELPSSVVSLK